MKRQVEINYMKFVAVGDGTGKTDEVLSDDDDSFLRVINDDSGMDRSLTPDNQVHVYQEFLRKFGIPDDISEDQTLDDVGKLFEYKMKISTLRLDIIDLENRLADESTSLAGDTSALDARDFGGLRGRTRTINLWTVPTKRILR
jgi:hypothetical protein